MGDRKRWSVTYTKHIKQKRKVYQDGFLELQSSGPKVMLYDECEKLLESRFVKKDDIIESGETLAFPSHLVDIGDLYGDHKPISSLSFQGKDEKVLEKSGSLHNNKFGRNSSSVMLYDTTRRLLDSRFLKRNEIVSSGESLVFDGHLVDIGECEGDSKPPKDLSLQRINCEAVGKTERTYNRAKITTNSKFPAGTSIFS
ncbi:uncharacterized protein Fot_12612 [Forsythia ovata]|uniref:5'-3' DNA helicase ZGRF1-like N-terminal domain-containing protein n=1 Tax=Forsythia ovata TaxID=205694 RepID=A0ABD1WN15_9LAMI